MATGSRLLASKKNATGYWLLASKKNATGSRLLASKKNATGYWLPASKKKCYWLLAAGFQEEMLPASGLQLKNINNEQQSPFY